MSEPKTVGFLMGLGQGWAGQSPRRGSSFCSSIPAPGRTRGMPCGDPQGVVEGPTTATGSIQQLLWGCGDRVTPQTSQSPGLSKLTPLPSPLGQGAGSWLPLPPRGLSPPCPALLLACCTLWRGKEKRKTQPRCH